jgi:hypothetical protein
MKSSLRGIHFHAREIETPPTLPRPGSFDTSLTIPAEIINATQHVERFDTACEFWVIINTVIWQHYDIPNPGIPEYITIGVAEAAYHQLLNWAANLPPSQARGEENDHGIMMMQ